MRLLLTKFFSIGAILLTVHEPLRAEPKNVRLEPILSKVEEFVGGEKNADALGFNAIENVTQSSQKVEDTWFSEVTIQREREGIFQMLTPSTEEPFFAPKSTDIALQAAFNLRSLPALIREYHKANGTEKAADKYLSSEVVGTTLEQFFSSEEAIRVQVCVDFDDKNTLNLGKESIGRPHMAIRLDGAEETIDAIVQHYIASRGALFTKRETDTGYLYTLPAYFSEALADYLPVIEINTKEHFAVIASDKTMLDRLYSEDQHIGTDPAFTHTWRKLPEKASLKLYVSKRAIEGLHHFYKLSKKEQWSNNSFLLQNQTAITLGLAQLNNSSSGLGISLASEENKDVLSVKSPIPGNLFFWLLSK